MGVLNDRIREARKMRGITLNDLARLIGVKEATVQRYESGAIANIKYTHLTAIAEILGVSPVYLMGWADDPNFEAPAEKLNAATGTPKELEYFEKYKGLKQEDKRTVERVIDLAYMGSQYRDERPTRPISFISLPVSAGTGVTLQQDGEEATIDIPLTPTSRRADFVLRVAGDSMEPQYSDGDLLLISYGEYPEKGELGIFAVNGEGFFKRLGEGRLVSLNAAYAPIVFHEGDDVRTFGKVIGKTEQI